MPKDTRVTMASAFLTIKQSLAQLPPDALQSIRDACAQSLTSLRSACP
jgi:hypothetical protein